MQILLVSDVPVRPELGAGRPYYELARELRNLGHTVETFEQADAFGGARRSGVAERIRPRRFASRAARYVRTHARHFDVVDANQGNLPYSSTALGLSGILVARSAGFFPFYRAHLEDARRRWPDRIPGSRPAQYLRRWHAARNFASEQRSFERCDLAIFPNREETAYAERTVRPGRRSVTIPLGLSDELAERLATAAWPVEQRLAEQRVACIGAWSLRKGAADWGRIISTVREEVPEARFRFLGTAVDREEVLRDLGPVSEDGIEIVPWFDADDLPELLADVTVGALPSYVEAGPFSILETLGAALPSVSYDAPGCRELIPARDWLAPLGDATAFGATTARLLTTSVADYARRATRALDSVAGYRWPSIAVQTVDAYREALASRR